MCLRIDHKRRPSFLRTIFWCRLCACVCVHVCMCVYLCIRAFLRARLSSNIARTQRNFSRKSLYKISCKGFKLFCRFCDTYVYLCIIYHNVSRAVYVYFCYRKASVARKKRDQRGYHFSWRTCAAFRGGKTSSPSRKLSNYNCRYREVFYEISLRSYRAITYFSERNDVFQYSKILQWANFFHSSYKLVEGPNEQNRVRPVSPKIVYPMLFKKKKSCFDAFHIMWESKHFFQKK